MSGLLKKTSLKVAKNVTNWFRLDGITLPFNLFLSRHLFSWCISLFKSLKVTSNHQHHLPLTRFLSLCLNLNPYFHSSLFSFSTAPSLISSCGLLLLLLPGSLHHTFFSLFYFFPPSCCSVLSIFYQKTWQYRHLKMSFSLLNTQLLWLERVAMWKALFKICVFTVGPCS